MNLDKYAKAIVGAVASAAGIYFGVTGSGGSVLAGLVAALFSLAATGAVIWGVPNKVVAEIESGIRQVQLPAQVDVQAAMDQAQSIADQTVVMAPVK